MNLTAMINALKRGEVSSAELIRQSLHAIGERNGELNAFVELFDGEAVSLAAASDARRAEGRELSPLDGIPFAIKDNFLYEGHRCECASRMLSGFIAPYSSTMLERLTAAGAIPLGRVNMDEFAMGTRCDYSKFGLTRNPRNPQLSPGGSSGGSAAAVAAGFVPFALGSDTGGSTRLPAAWCGITGFKPARGCLSRWGLVAFSSSLDSVGLLMERPEDCFPLMDCLSGCDGRDSTLRDDLWDEGTPIRRIILWEGTTPDGMEEKLSALGLKAERRPAPDLETALAAYRVISSAEASSNLARYDGLRYGLSREGEGLQGSICESRSDGFGEEVKRRLMMGIHALSHDELFPRAMAFRSRFVRELTESLPEGTALLSSASPLSPPTISLHSDAESDSHADAYAVPASLAGLPSLSLPNGLCLTGGRSSGKALLKLGERLMELSADL